MADVSEDGHMRVKSQRSYSDVQKGYTAFSDGDVLVAKVTPCFENNKITLATLNTPCGFGSTEFHVVRGNSDTLDQRYLLHFLRQDWVRIAGQRRMTGSGGQRRVPAAFLRELAIPLLPMREQKRVAAILDHTAELQRKVETRLQELRRLETSVVQRAMKAADSRITNFGDVFWFQEGPGVRNWQFTNTGVKLLNVSNVTVDGVLDTSRSKNHVSFEEARGKYAHFLVDAGDLIMPCSGIPIDDDGLLRTRSAFATEDQLPLCMNTSTIRFKTEHGSGFLHFLRGWLQTPEFRSQITRLVTGSAQKNFGPSHLKQLKITLPAKEVVIRMVREVEAIHELQKRAEGERTRMQMLFASLQNRGFRGEL
jgi:type I restriction enzyme S subunit